MIRGGGRSIRSSAKKVFILPGHLISGPPHRLKGASLEAGGLAPAAFPTGRIKSQPHPTRSVPRIRTRTEGMYSRVLSF